MEDSVRRALRERFHLPAVRPEWLKEALDEAKSTRTVDAISGVCNLLLTSNLRTSSLGSLPPNVTHKHNETVKGPILAQIEELVNIGVPIESRYTSDDSKSKIFKLCLHDGAQQFFALEKTPIQQLSSSLPAGTKVRLSLAFLGRAFLFLLFAFAMFLFFQYALLISLFSIYQYF